MMVDVLSHYYASSMLFHKYTYNTLSRQIPQCTVRVSFTSRRSSASRKIEQTGATNMTNDDRRNNNNNNTANHNSSPPTTQLVREPWIPTVISKRRTLHSASFSLQRFIPIFYFSPSIAHRPKQRMGESGLGFFRALRRLGEDISRSVFYATACPFPSVHSTAQGNPWW
jgi:hypothetical protein